MWPPATFFHKFGLVRFDRLAEASRFFLYLLELENLPSDAIDYSILVLFWMSMMISCR